MNDERIFASLRTTLDEGVQPDPAFADRLFERLAVDLHFRTSETTLRPAWRLGRERSSTGTSRRSPVRLRLAAVVALAVTAFGTVLAVSSLVGSRGIVSPIASSSVGPSAMPSVRPSAVASLAPALPSRAPGEPWASIDWVQTDLEHVAGQTSFHLTSIVAFGGGFVAVGDESGLPARIAKIWLSTNGRHWENVATGPEFSGYGITDIAAGQDGLVAVGNKDSGGGAVWRSPDGRRWTRDPQSTPLAPFRNVAVGPTGVIGLVDFGIPVFSSGPGLWENLGKGVLSDQPMDLADVWGDASRVVLVGSDRGLDQLCHAAAWWSTDGRSWQRASIDPPGRGFEYLSTAPGGVVVQGVSGSCDGGATPAAFWFSADGVAFRQVPVALPDGWCLPRDSDLCLSGDRGHVVIVGPSGDALISEDGSSWWRAGGSIHGASTLDPIGQGFTQLAVGQLGIVASVQSSTGDFTVWYGQANAP